MNLTERLFTFKVSLIMGSIGGLIYNIYDLNSVFLLSIFVAIIWWFFLITLPHKVETLQE